MTVSYRMHYLVDRRGKLQYINNTALDDSIHLETPPSERKCVQWRKSAKTLEKLFHPVIRVSFGYCDNMMRASLQTPWQHDKHSSPFIEKHMPAV